MNFRGCTGFDRRNRRAACTNGLIGWPGKKPIKQSNANADDIGLAPSVEEADAILATLGYEAPAELAVA